MQVGVRSDPSTYRRLADRRVSSWCTNGGALSEPPLLGRPSRLVGKFGFDPLKQLEPWHYGGFGDDLKPG